MIIDKYSPLFTSGLELAFQSARHEEHVYLLIDGAFIPGLYRKFCSRYGSDKVEVLFDQGRPCTDEMRSVSPFIYSLDELDKSLFDLLIGCSGFPMLSVIINGEEITDIAKRLSRWCLVENDSQLFNFRFADTRCLPYIFAALNRDQRSYFCGGAAEWKYIDRGGNWQALNIAEVAPQGCPVPIVLDSPQFAEIVRAGEADEVIAALTRFGKAGGCQPSVLFKNISQALYFANELGIDESLRADWCDFCLSRKFEFIPSEVEMQKSLFLNSWV